jgi:hypothetical protein
MDVWCSSDYYFNNQEGRWQFFIEQKVDTYWVNEDLSLTHCQNEGLKTGRRIVKNGGLTTGGRTFKMRDWQQVDTLSKIEAWQQVDALSKWRPDNKWTHCQQVDALSEQNEGQTTGRSTVKIKAWQQVGTLSKWGMTAGEVDALSHEAQATGGRTVKIKYR